MDSNFFEDLKVEGANEYLRLLKLQRDYEENKISEYDMTDKQVCELAHLYMEQIKKLENNYNKSKKKAFELKQKIFKK